ncbi:MAG: LamG domain-containing protein [Candidatus Marinimicrobia bacterium]|nr:LamG domain-containing protein [Candidatus Neomarinimicrobiota bacterium]MCF7829365.1 LamG domain-containing protein [Candidatus Neomarinimicrobiota bacterium]MCF7880851.1 LamG domain-containing protein [Candidatus Neomarinimicrobiota bacterium]
MSKRYMLFILAFIIMGMIGSCEESTTEPWADLSESYQLTVNVINETDSPTEADLAVLKNGEVIESETASSAQYTLPSAEPYVIRAIKSFATGETDTLTYTVALAEDWEHTFTFITGDIDANLLAHYSFEGNLDEATSQWSAGSETGDRITNTGGSISFASGKVGQAAVFDGASGIRLPDTLITDHTYAVSLWLNPASINQFTTAFFGGTVNDDVEAWISLTPAGPGDDAYTMLWNRLFDANTGDDIWYDGTTGMQIPVNQWSHIVFSADAGKLKVYVDGVEKFSGSDHPDVFSAYNAIFALAVNHWDVPFEGMMDELRVYSRAIGERTVANLMNE